MIEQKEYIGGKAFAGLNTTILINGKMLDGIQELNIYDLDNSTYIELERVVFDENELVDTMRCGAAFSFVLMNNLNSSGYKADNCSINKFNMTLSMNAKEQVLRQKITIKAYSFVFRKDVRTEEMKKAELEDYKYLTGIIKENQNKNKDAIQEKKELHEFEDALRKIERQTKEAIDALPVKIEIVDKDIIWLNAKEPEKIKDYIQPRKLKKKNK
jgi:hypothetical protein